MDKISLKKIYKYITYYQAIKNNKISSTKIYHSDKSDARFSVTELDHEFIFSFYTSKKSFNFIKRYMDYKKELLTYNEIEASALTFEMISSKIGEDKFMTYCQNKKLNNPFRKTIIKNYLRSPLKQDRINYYEFKRNKIKYYLHTGFVELYNTIAPQLTKQLKRVMETDKKIVFVGYSFGSVLARLAYLVYFLKNPENLDKIECYAFSTPNIGNKFFEKYFELLHRKEKNRRLFIINCDDDCMYNMFSKRFGFHFMKSTLLIKRNNERKKIYKIEDYRYIIKNLL